MAHPVLPLAFLIACSATSATSSGAVPYQIEERQWDARPLLVFSPDPDDPRWHEQVEALDAAELGIIERDIDDVRIIGAGGTVGGAPMLAEDVEALRSRYGVGASDFAVILVGRDGDQKLRSAEPVAMQRVFETIDAMPMRRREMHSG